MSAKAIQINGKWYVRVNFGGRRKQKIANSQSKAEALARAVNNELRRYSTTAGENVRDLSIRVINPLLVEDTPCDGGIIPPVLLGLSGCLAEYDEHKPHGYVYFLCADDAVVYIGTTRNLAHRIRSHRRTGYMEWDRVLYVVVRDGDEPFEVEAAFIGALKPKYNGAPSLLISKKVERHYLREYGL